MIENNIENEFQNGINISEISKNIIPIPKTLSHNPYEVRKVKKLNHFHLGIFPFGINND